MIKDTDLIYADTEMLISCLEDMLKNNYALDEALEYFRWIEQDGEAPQEAWDKMSRFVHQNSESLDELNDCIDLLSDVVMPD